MYQVSVLIANTPLSIDKPFSYLSETQLFFGALVKVNFAHRIAFGFVVEDSKQCWDSNGLKFIDEVINEGAFSNEQYDYACWLSSVCYKPINQLLNQMIIEPLRKANPFATLSKYYYCVNQCHGLKLTPKQEQLVTFMGNQTIAHDQLCKHFTLSFIKTCVDKRILNKSVHYPIVEKSKVSPDLTSRVIYPMKKVCLLTNGYHAFITHIAPIIAAQLQTNKRILVLVANDNGLHAMKGLMETLFSNVVCYSASMNGRDKLAAIYAFKHDANLTLATQAVLSLDNKYDCVIVIDSSARAYEFSSFAHVGLQRYLDYMNYRYATQIINVSQTPSLAQWQDNALIEFPISPINIEMVDMVVHYRNNTGLLSQATLKMIAQTLRDNKSCFVWVNRKGSYHVVKCNSCSSVLTCDSCGRLLTYSDASNSYHCYACNRDYHYTQCPQCGGSQFSYSNVGVERVAKILAHYFKNTSIIICDSDHPYNEQQIGENTIVVGTNAILTNPLLTWDCFIGIDVDSYYSSSDYYSNERSVNDCFALLNRCQSNAVLQVNDINHPYHDFIKNMDYSGYITFEKSYRKNAKLPPYTNEIRLTMRVKDSHDPLLDTITINSQHIACYGPNWIDTHTVMYSLYCRNGQLLDQAVEELVKINKNKWKNKVEINVGPYNS